MKKIQFSNRRPWRGILSLLTAAGVIGAAGGTAQAATYTVTNTNNSGAGSLRQAIINANGNGGADTINFNITTGSGVRTISPTTALDNITGPTTIDGTTQPGYTSTPVIEINGTNAAPRPAGGGGADGLTISGGNCTIRGLAITRFADAGIEISGGGNTITGCHIGINAAGTTAAGNNLGIFIFNVANNTIGGTTVAARNVISGNNTDGLFILNTGAINNQILGNYIGTNLAGTSAVPNGQDGIQIQNAASNIVNGNVISGNAANGVFCLLNANTTSIKSNRIGTNAAGTGGLGNGGNGIEINNASGAAIGGIGGSGSGVVSDGNSIGFNGGNGIYLFGTSSTGATVVSNTIASNGQGSPPAGSGNGVSIIQAPGARIGGLGEFTGNGGPVTEGNVITGNAADGIFLVESNGNTFTNNRISANGQVGIDLGGDNATPNDVDDTDGGPNRTQNFPELTLAQLAASQVTVSGNLNSTASTQFRVEYFKAAPDPSGFGEGATPLTTQTVTTDATGNVALSVTLTSAQAGLGDAITATATNLTTGDTSEFSANATVIADTTAPVVAITDPANNSELPNLTRIGGTASDENGGSGVTPSSVTVSIQRTRDNLFWDGTAWSSATRVLLPVSFDPPSTFWQKLDQLPPTDTSDVNLLLQAHVVDLAGNASDSNVVRVIPLPPAPTITGVSPNEGPIGTGITITGTNLASATGVSFNNVFATFTVISNTQVVATVPTGATTGLIRVITRGGSALSSGNFTVTPGAVPTPTPTATPTATPGGTPQPTATPGGTPQPTATPGGTPQPTATPGGTPQPTATPGGTPQPTSTPVPTPIPDPLAPAVNFTSPENGDRLVRFPTIAGTATDNVGGSGVQQVLVFLRRSTDGRYWTGSQWVPQQSTLTATLTGAPTNRIFRVATAPTGNNLLSDVYYLSAVAFDGSRNRGQKTVSFRILDVTAPTVVITSPANSARLTALTEVRGTLTDNTTGSGPALVWLFIRRSSDGKYWDGARWVTPLATLRTTLAGSGSTVIWTRDTALPAPPATGSEAYYITAAGYDHYGNRSIQTHAVIMTAPPAGTTAASRGSADLSSIAASATTGTLRLRFYKALAAASATDATNWTVVINGVPATLEAASLDAAGTVVTLSVAEGALTPGANATVSWAGLNSASGTALTSGSSTIAVR